MSAGTELPFSIRNGNGIPSSGLQGNSSGAQPCGLAPLARVRADMQHVMVLTANAAQKGGG